MIRRARIALVLSLAATALPACVEHQPDDNPTEADWAMIKQNLLPAIPPMEHKVGATIGDRVIFLGCDVDQTAVQPGKPFAITYYWKVNAAPDNDWKLFTHVGGPNGQPFINADHTPIYNKYPVRLWKAGDIIKDVQNLSVPQSWSAPVVNVYVGLWKSQSSRIPITNDPSKANDGTDRVLAVSLPVSGHVAGPAKKLVVRRASGPISVDGKLDEPAWAQAQSTGPFVNSLTGAPAEHAADVKVLYDDKNLYLGFTVADPDVSSDIKDHDGKVYTQDAVELMVDADGDGQSYEEFEVSPANVTFDSYLPSYRQNQNDWESGMKSAVVVDGSLNDSSDTDKGYTAEVAIPLTAFQGRQAKALRLPPAPGDSWRANFYELDLEKGKPLAGYAWSPTMTNDFHALAQFGELDFANASGVVPSLAAASAPSSAPIAFRPGLPMSPGPHPMMMPNPRLLPGVPLPRPPGMTGVPGPVETVPAGMTVPPTAPLDTERLHQRKMP